MLKSLFIIATILIAAVLASQQLEEGQRQHHKRQHVATHGGQLAQLSQHHSIQDASKEHVKHHRINVPLAPHHSKSHRNGRRHKASRSGKSSKSHQQKAHHHKQQAHKPHGHARRHH
ncbi:histidine-rich glycoprotein [Drosophila novamexicana]|uniref:histidine-rich glycoprotein n=1 Tax=Drosophila novamexicana TaxID=47314 RepID=UPI0011E5AF0A|nr:histidine-rich glycoprotein [Drosophila novamexicana]